MYTKYEEKSGSQARLIIVFFLTDLRRPSVIPGLLKITFLSFTFFATKAVIVNGSVLIKETPISVIGVAIFRQLIPSNFCKPIFKLSNIICTFVTKRKPRSFAIRSYFDQEAM